MRRLLITLLSTLALLGGAAIVPASASAAVVGGCGGAQGQYGNSSGYQIRINGFWDGCTNGDLYLYPGRTSTANPNFDGEYVWTDYCWAILVHVSTMRADGQWRLAANRTLNWTTSGGDGWSELADGWELYDFYAVVPSGFC